MNTAHKEDFDRFHRNNPAVWELFVQYTHTMIATGRRRYSARMVIYRIRWETDLTTKSGDGFKINNNHTPYYARLFNQEYPHHVGFFSLRRIQGETDLTIPPNVHHNP
jgi:hypothetical protein